MKKQKAAVKALAHEVAAKVKPLPPKAPVSGKLLPEPKRQKLIAALKKLHPMD